MGIVDNDEFEKIVEDAFESNDRVHIFSEKYSSRKEKLLRGCNMKRNIKDVWKKALTLCSMWCWCYWRGRGNSIRHQ